MQCKLYVSYRPDPGCMAVDAFSSNWHSIMFYAFPTPFSVLTQTIQKIEKEEATGVVVAPNWPTQVWYPALMRLLIAHPLLISPDKSNLSLRSLLSTRNTPSSQDPAVVGLPCVRKSLEETGISEQATTIMLKAWRQGTEKQYDTYLKEWVLYCNSTGCDLLSAPLYVGINYLADLAGRVGYSAVNTARSALSSVITLRDGSSFGKHPMVKRLLKGVFEDKPSLPRYGKTWDLNVLLCFLRTLPEYDKISLKELTYKLVVLIAILSGQRCQTIHALSMHRGKLYVFGR